MYFLTHKMDIFFIFIAKNTNTERILFFSILRMTLIVIENFMSLKSNSSPDYL